MNDFADKDFTNCDCFIGVFLSHGLRRKKDNEQCIKSKDDVEGPTVRELTDVFK